VRKREGGQSAVEKDRMIERMLFAEETLKPMSALEVGTYKNDS
jgi:hypothetical protein